MRKTWIVAFALLLVSVAGFTQAPSPTPLSDEALAAILGDTDDGGACPLPQHGPLFAPAPTKASCTATAQCESGTVMCTGNPTCTGVDRDCSILERGHVVCGGVTTNCPTACCNSGTAQDKACCRCDATGGCQDCCRCAGGTIGQCALQCG
jgi:hypothetical protein